VAVLTAATVAQAVEQTPKNGCTSPQSYTGSLTSPVLNTVVSPPANLRFKAWFEIEAFAAGNYDHTYVEYSVPPPQVGDPRDWVELGKLSDLAPANTGAGQQDLPYSNNGTSVPPSFPGTQYSFPLPAETVGLQVRFRFDTVDNTFQGFRGVGIDDIDIDSNPAGRARGSSVADPDQPTERQRQEPGDLAETRDPVR
jgi:hypothetical protein